MSNNSDRKHYLQLQKPQVSAIANYHRLDVSQVLPMWVSGLVGGASGLLAQCATYPLHVLRRRMQVWGGRRVCGGRRVGHDCAVSRCRLGERVYRGRERGGRPAAEHLHARRALPRPVQGLCDELL